MCTDRPQSVILQFRDMNADLGRRILIVERERDLSELWASALEHPLVRCTEALDPSHGLGLARTSPFDLWLVDANLPRSGTQMLVSQRPESSRLLLVSSDQDFRERDAFAMGAVGLLHKPFSLDLLREGVFRLLELDVSKSERVHPRRAVQLPVHIHHSGLGFGLEGQVLNVSKGGLFVLSPSPFVEQAQVLDFAIQTPQGDLLGGQGEVRWVRRSRESALLSGFGLQFKDLAPKTQSWIEGLSL